MAGLRLLQAHFRIGKYSQLKVSIYYCNPVTGKVDLCSGNVHQEAAHAARWQLIFEGEGRHIPEEDHQAQKIRKLFRKEVSELHAQAYPVVSTATEPTIALTGSCAFRDYIYEYWGKGTVSPLKRLYRNVEAQESSGVTKEDMVAVLIPRDTDFTLLSEDHVEEVFDKITVHLEGFVKKSEAAGLINPQIQIHKPEPFGYPTPTFKTGSVLVYQPAGKQPGSSRTTIYYAVDIKVPLDREAVKPLLASVASEGRKGRVFAERLDSLILGELNFVKRFSAGEVRKHKAVVRIYLLARLELMQPRLDTVSRMVLIHAVNYLSGVYEPFIQLSHELRERPLYMLVRNGELFGASDKERFVPQVESSTGRGAGHSK